MIRKLLLLSSLAALAFFVVPTGEAQGAPQEPVVATFPTADGGNYAALQKQASYVIECQSTACARIYNTSRITDGGPALANCDSSDVFRIPSGLQSAGARYEFQTGGLNAIRVANADGGSANCALWFDTKNP